MANKLCVLLDANIIIVLHEFGIWEMLVQRVTLLIPATVLAEAQHYRDSQSGEIIPIHLTGMLGAGIIQSIEATAAQIAHLFEQFDRVFIERIDKGEAEALALLFDDAVTDHYFCTADGPAIRALSLLDRKDMGISLEKMLSQVGMSRKIPYQYSDAFFKKLLDRGAQERIRGEGLRHSGKRKNTDKTQ